MKTWQEKMRPVYHFASIDSTQPLARRLAIQGAEAGTLVLADEQTLGRGREERLFCSPLGGAYFSLVLRPCFSMELAPLASLAAGVGCCRAIESYAPVHVELKWPNDLMVHNRKLGGILAECIPCQPDGSAFALVLGVGINVNSALPDFPHSIRSIITTLKTETRTTFSPIALSLLLATEIEHWLHVLSRDYTLILAHWQHRDFLLGREIAIYSGEERVHGLAAGLDENGCYCLKKKDGCLQKIAAGDILYTSSQGSSQENRMREGQ